MPAVHTVVTHGRDANQSWERFTKAEPAIAARFRHLETFHTSGRGITNGGQQPRSQGTAHVVATYREALEPAAGGPDELGQHAASGETPTYDRLGPDPERDIDESDGPGEWSAEQAAMHIEDDSR